MEIDDYLKEKKRVIETVLDALLPSSQEYPTTIHESVRYSVFSGGKRIRPILAVASYEACGGEDLERFLSVACSIELIHTFSFIHDDLPCMDDDDYRRGTKTSHVVFGEAIALLAGDALFNMAFEVILGSRFDDSVKVRVMEEITSSVGTKGVIGGQVVDVISEGEDPTPEKLEFIHSRKTGKLIEASLKVGAICAGVSPEKVLWIGQAGSKLGLAFQIVDDLLDVEGDFEVVGKRGGKDSCHGKLTYPALYGLPRSRELAQDLCSEAKSLFTKFGEKGEILSGLTDFIADRIY